MKKMFIAILFALAALSAFAQSYKDFDYKISKGFDVSVFERGLKGKTTIPQDKIDMVVSLIQKGILVIYPNQNKTVWYAGSVKAVMETKDSKEFMEIMATVLAVYCGNFKGNYLYWCEGWLTTDKMFFEYSASWDKFELYEVW